MLKLILIPFFLIIVNFSQAKEYEYQQFLADNKIIPFSCYFIFWTLVEKITLDDKRLGA